MPAATGRRGHAAAAGTSGAARTDTWSAVRRLRHVAVLALLVVTVVAAVVLVPLHGWSYYRTPLRVRALHRSHAVLRPAGSVGRALGVTGAAAMLVMHLYSLRKRRPRLFRSGTVPAWLEFHIFCGIVGPSLITLHTSFKFNGIVAVAYWSMVLVTLSGFVGRYLYVRIPRTLRGQEMSLQDMEATAAALKEQLAAAGLPETVLGEIAAFERRVTEQLSGPATVAGLVTGDALLRWRLNRLRRRVRRPGLGHELIARAVDLELQRAVMLRRIAYLRTTRRLFELWHVFHQPLAVVMLVIVVLHVGTAVYFGYGFTGR